VLLELFACALHWLQGSPCSIAIWWIYMVSHSISKFWCYCSSFL